MVHNEGNNAYDQTNNVGCITALSPSVSFRSLVLQPAGGNVGIGTTAPTSFALQVAGSVGPNADNSGNLGSAALRWNTVFAANGTINTSDARLKQGIRPLAYGLRELMQMRPVTFQWKDVSDQRTHPGLLAQEVEQVVPEVIVRSPDASAPLGMSYTGLIPLMIKPSRSSRPRSPRSKPKMLN